MAGRAEPPQHDLPSPGIRPAGHGRIRAWVSWSTGKDSAYALHLAQEDRRVEVLGLFTTVDQDAGTVAYNGVPVSLAHAQADALGLPPHLLSVPAACPARDRETLRRAVLAREAVPDGVKTMIFGDAGGTDIRSSRAARLAGLGIDAVFPLWGMDTRRLSRDILAAGIRAVITRVDPCVLDAGWAGRLFGEASSGPSARVPIRAGRTASPTRSRAAAPTSATPSRSCWNGSCGGRGRCTRR